MATKARKKPTPDQQSAALPDIVFAQASPSSVGGTSLFETVRTIDHANVEAYMSEPAVVSAAASRLRAAGFQVLDITPTTINIAGTPSLYEEYFAIRLVAEERPVLKPQNTEDTATFIECPDTDLPGLIPADRSPAAEVLEGVAIEEAR